jgi:uncharacterized protein YcfJ
MMDKREAVKALAEIVVSTVVGAVVTKTLSSNVPASNRYKLAEMSGMFAGWYVTNKYQTQLNQLVDDYFDKRAAR